MTARIDLLGGRASVDTLDLLARSRATDRDIVVLSGTLLEGFGNLHSDLDLYVISHELPLHSADDPPARLVVREDGRVRRFNETLAGAFDIVLDVQYYTFRELDTLARSLRALYLESRQHTRIFRRTLHHEDEDLIHKLLTGTVIRNEAGSFDINSTFDAGSFCFLKYRNEVGGYPEFRDLIGSWSAGDLDTCLYNTRGYLVSQVSGMMFLAGSTNPRPKWFLRRLGSLGGSYTGLRDGVIQWMSEDRRTDARKREGFESACNLIDMTYAHVRHLLNEGRGYFRTTEALALTDREFSERKPRSRDALAEWQLRRRIFSDAEPPLFAMLDNNLSGLREVI
jgi:hypothetical protein